MVYFAKGNIDRWYILQWEMLIDWVWVATWTYRQIGYGVEMKEMPQALDNGSKQYSCPLGDCEMAGESDAPILILAFR